MSHWNLSLACKHLYGSTETYINHANGVWVETPDGNYWLTPAMRELAFYLATTLYIDRDLAVSYMDAERVAA